MTLSNQESGKYLGSRGRFDLVKSSGVEVKHTRTLNNTCAFNLWTNMKGHNRPVKFISSIFLGDS